jgi:spore germination protein KA
MKWLPRFFKKRRLGKDKPQLKLDNDKLDIGEREAIQRELTLTASLDENVKTLRLISGPSSDVIIRELKVGQAKARAAVIHIATLAETALVESLIGTLSVDPFQTPVGEAQKQEIFSEFKNRLLQSAEAREVETISDMWEELAGGNTAVVFDGTPRALVCATQATVRRAIEEPAAETVIRGAREGFVESLRINIALIRRRIKTPNLWVEDFVLGHLTGTDVSVMYIKGLAGEELVQEVRKRVSSIEIDGITESGDIEDMIEDSPFSVFPLVFRTERVDRVVSMLLEGRVCIITDNTPFVMVVPMNFPMLLQAPDDYYEKIPIGTFLRILRLTAFAAAIILPGTYVAVITFHNELIPTELLLRLTAAKEGVPFPVVVEVFMMELVFEFLREAGIRLPTAIGPAVTIVGALVLGDAAIRAGLVSAPVVIIVSLTAIASFTVPTFSFGIAARLIRFIFIILGGIIGLFGIEFGLLVLLVLLSSLRSFGYPFLSPIAPLVISDWKDLYIRTWRWDEVARPKLEGAREPIRQRKGQMPRPGKQEEGKNKIREKRTTSDPGEDK